MLRTIEIIEGWDGAPGVSVAAMVQGTRNECVDVGGARFDRGHDRD